MARTGYPADPVTARGQATRRRLLAAAEEVFGDKGFERASIVDVTRGARGGAGTFYVYFIDKRAIFSELGHDLRRHIAEAVEASATSWACAGCRGRSATHRRTSSTR